MQCASLDFASFVIYPESKATEVILSALKPLSLSHLFQDKEMQLVEFKETHCIIGQLGTIQCSGRTEKKVGGQRA